MNVSIQLVNDTLFISPSGRLDTVNSAELKSKIEADGTTGCDIVFDLSGVEYISSAGLRLLVALQKQVMADGKKLTLRNPNKVVSEIFRVAGFNKAFTIE